MWALWHLLGEAWLTARSQAQVLAQAPAADGQANETILAAALPRRAVPQSVGARQDGGMPYHAFLWPVPDTNTSAAGAISATLYNDSRQAQNVSSRLRLITQADDLSIPWVLSNHLARCLDGHRCCWQC